MAHRTFIRHARSGSFPAWCAWLWCVVGISFFAGAGGAGIVAWLLLAPAGTLLVGSGVSGLLFPGDARIASFAALGAVAGVLMAPWTALSAGVVWAIGLAVGALACAVAAGWASLGSGVRPDGAGDRYASVFAADASLDEALLASFSLSVARLAPSEIDRVRDELAEARAVFRERGFRERPELFHRTPPAFGEVAAERGRALGMGFERLGAPSEYEPHPGLPGRERWLALAANRTATAWCVRTDPDRPWVVAVHGFGLGRPALDFAALGARRLARRGYNLLLPTLALHGPRGRGLRSADGFLSGEVVDTLNAIAQSVWDIRRWVAWASEQGARAIGLYGVSLGAYHASIVAGLDHRVAGAVFGVPAVDLAAILARHTPPLFADQLARGGIFEHEMRDLWHVASPLGVPARAEGFDVGLFHAAWDRVIPEGQADALWQHWGEPPRRSYRGGHLTYRVRPGIAAFIDERLGAALGAGGSSG